MQINIKFITALISGWIAFSSCEKDNRLMYENDPRVYFYKSPRTNLATADSVNFTFGIYPPDKVTDTVWLRLQIMGLTENRDRVINITADANSTAVEGTHYELGELVMPAGQGSVEIPLVIYKTPDLADTTLHLFLTVGESADFKPGFTDSNSRLSRLKYKVSFTSKLLKPANWDWSLVNLFGAYSVVKHQYIIQWTGIPDLSTIRFPADQNFAVQTVKAALAAHEKEHGPLYDENGERITLP